VNKPTKAALFIVVFWETVSMGSARRPPMRADGNVVGLIAVGSWLALDLPDDLSI
jgi:hypothetical protein